MIKSVTILSIENTIERLELPAFHPHAYPIAERRNQYFDAYRMLDDFFDYSDLDEYSYGQLHDRLEHAYVSGGL